MTPEPWENAISDAMIARFWSNVSIAGEDDCWEWSLAPCANGYGHLSVVIDGSETKIKAHRLSFRIHNEGQLPECVCHKCDNPICVNPRHLFAGDRTINNADMCAKGRNVPPVQHQGEKNSYAKLTEAEVCAIFLLRDEGWKLDQIASALKTTKSNISLILAGKRWAHADRLRARACVNFCREFPTDWLNARHLVYLKEPTEFATIPGFDGLLAVAKENPCS